MRKLKDKKIILCKKISGRDSSGFMVNGYMPIHPTPNIWSYFKQLSASLLHASNSTFASEECFFAVNWSEYLRKANPTDLYVYYQGILYQVTRIDPFEDYKRDLYLYCKRTTTKITEFIAYDPTKL